MCNDLTRLTSLQWASIVARPINFKSLYHALRPWSQGAEPHPMPVAPSKSNSTINRSLAKVRSRARMRLIADLSTRCPSHRRQRRQYYGRQADISAVCLQVIASAADGQAARGGGEESI